MQHWRWNSQRICTITIYSRLYKTTNSCEDSIKPYLNSTPNIIPLPEQEQKQCEGMMTKHECHKVLCNMKNNKSPGLDGFPYEFYKHFWNSICDILVESYNESHIIGKLSESQKVSLLSIWPTVYKMDPSPLQ